MDENFFYRRRIGLKHSFFWLMAALMLLLALGVWLLALGVQTSPFASPFVSSM